MIPPLSNMKACICGCVKDCETFLDPVFANIRQVVALFEDYHIVVSYDLSSDKSLQKLCALKKTWFGDKMDILINKEPCSNIRVQNICRARNECLRWMRGRQPFDYFFMVDMDDVCSLPIRLDAVEDALQKRDEWDAVSFHRGDYYDIWALSAAPFYFSCWHFAPRPRDVVAQMKTFITNALDTSIGEFYDCVSAFNGFAIYKAAAFADVWYEWEMTKIVDLMPREWIETSMQATQKSIQISPTSDDCEHRFFHLQAFLRGARICISPRKLFPADVFETDCTLVSSRGLLRSCTVHSLHPVSSIHHISNYNVTDVAAWGGSVYVCGSAMRHFVECVFPLITQRFVLVTGDCDLNCPHDMFGNDDAFVEFISSDRIIHWFAQNCTGHHPKLTKLPIGLDYHTMTAAAPTPWGPRTLPTEQERILLEIRQQQQRQSRRLCAYVHFAMNTIAQRLVPPECVEYEEKAVPRRTTWERQAQCAFVLSPHGGGLDCHRTWEALALGCIPIMRSSPLDALFTGLPVWIVHDWSEVTLENMKKKKEKAQLCASIPAPLHLSYWVQQINALTCTFS